MFIILWEYKVRKDRIKDFELLYNSTGSWTEVFRKYEGYLNSELYKKSGEENTYLTIDRWKTEADFRKFAESKDPDYMLLDKKGDELTEKETRIGMFEVI